MANDKDDVMKKAGDVFRSAFKTPAAKPVEAKPAEMSAALERRRQSRPSAYEDEMPKESDAVKRLGDISRSAFGSKK
jgi:hypothetical protein